MISFKKLRLPLILLWYITGATIVYYLAYFLRFDGKIPSIFFKTFKNTLSIYILTNILFYMLFRIHALIFTYFSIHDAIKIIYVHICSTTSFYLLCYLKAGLNFKNYPRSVPIISLLLLMGWMFGTKILRRIYREYTVSKKYNNVSSAQEKALVVGNLLEVDIFLRSMVYSKTNIKIIGIITDEQERLHQQLRGINIVGRVNELGNIIKKLSVTTTILFPPYNKPHLIKKIIKECEELKVKCIFKTLPSFSELPAKNTDISVIRKIELEDIIGRAEIKFDRELMEKHIKGKRILVTGAAGSIGSEIVRQIKNFEPSIIILLDINESGLYWLDIELDESSIFHKALICDITWEEKVKNILQEFTPDIIFHAAAYKHVPMMEDNIYAAVHSNIIGTYVIAKEAVKAHVKRFVFISTDKAIKPVSIMGSTKRIGELLLSQFKNSETTFVAVRFGNVLDSSGSVIPLFRKQIEKGGPVTVTTPHASRFFMSIQEAVSLVLIAGITGTKGDIMVLDMGEPVKIVDLAKHMISLAGLIEGEDIKIQFIGLRPGEKEKEESLTASDNLLPTFHPKIFKLKNKEEKEIDIERIQKYLNENNQKALIKFMSEIIPDSNLTASKIFS